jgi:serine phosphatase RsbU (regulator of sigma subunit)
VGYSDAARERFAHLPADASLPGPDALRDGRPRFFRSAVELGERYPRLAAAYRDDGNEAGAIVPIVGPRGPIGFLAVADSEPHPFTEDDRALLATIARQCGQALDRAFVYEREHATADTLVHSLLPERLPDVPGVQLAARYAPAPAPRPAVGGDFYDAFPAGEDRWVLVIGDVCGKGPDAAALTALVRWTLRAEAVHDSRPDHLLRRVNDAILAERDDLRFCTMACARLELAAPRPALRLSCAGHPAPLLLSADGRARPADVTGTVLGVVAHPELEERTYPLGPGEGLVLYTDGLLEAHAPERLLLPEDLAAAWAGAPGGATLEALAERVHARAVDHALGPPRDDVALLAARLSGR